MRIAYRSALDWIAVEGAGDATVIAFVSAMFNKQRSQVAADVENRRRLHEWKKKNWSSYKKTSDKTEQHASI